MRSGYYYKLNDRWMYKPNNYHAILSIVDKCYLFTNNNWWVPNRESKSFITWSNKSPSEEDLILLELMFP